nr:unnamed protein product [Callosobruchus chinensis]
MLQPVIRESFNGYMYCMQGKFKHTCVDITSNEVRTLNSNTGYDWTCVNCRAFGRDLKDLKALIIKLQNDISELKAEKARSTPGVDFEEIIAEISERQKRKNNIMLFNVPEPDQSSALAVQVASDKISCRNIGCRHTWVFVCCY